MLRYVAAYVETITDINSGTEVRVEIKKAISVPVEL